jgi:hypothetical protein
MASRTDISTTELDTGIFRFLGIVCSLFFAFCGGFIGGIWYEAQPPNYEYAAAFRNDQERREHHAKLAYHGLAHDVTMIYGDRLGEYFIRDGKRCAFVVPAKKQLAAK